MKEKRIIKSIGGGRHLNHHVEINVGMRGGGVCEGVAAAASRGA